MKHNMHHALTNEVGYDEDVALEPALYLWRPDPKNDSPLRKYQHWYWPLPFSILFLYWRFDSWKYALQHKEWGQAARLAAHYAVYFALFPLKTFFFAIWLSGLLTATVVTVTHQSEEIFIKDTLRKYDFCEAQFRSTRDAKMSNWFSSILWGGARRDAASALPRTPSSHTPCISPFRRDGVAARAPPLPDHAAVQVQGAPPPASPMVTGARPYVSHQRRAGDHQAEHRAAQEDRQPGGRRGQPRLDPALQAGLSALGAEGGKGGRRGCRRGCALAWHAATHPTHTAVASPHAREAPHDFPPVPTTSTGVLQDLFHLRRIYDESPIAIPKACSTPIVV